MNIARTLGYFSIKLFVKMYTTMKKKNKDMWKGIVCTEKFSEVIKYLTKNSKCNVYYTQSRQNKKNMKHKRKCIKYFFHF